MLIKRNFKKNISIFKKCELYSKTNGRIKRQRHTVKIASKEVFI